MEQASATLTQLLQRMQQQSAMAFTSDPKAASRELERRKAECYNREEGTLNQQDDYNCPPCGIIWRLLAAPLDANRFPAGTGLQRH